MRSEIESLAVRVPIDLTGEAYRLPNVWDRVATAAVVDDVLRLPTYGPDPEPTPAKCA